MAIFTIEVKGIGTYDRASLNRTYTIEAATAEEATREAQRRRGVDPQLKFVPAKAFRTDVVNMTEAFEAEKAQLQVPYEGDPAEGFNLTAALSEVDKREEEALKQAKKDRDLADQQLDTFQRTEGEEAAATATTQTFDEFVKQYVEPGRFHSGKRTDFFGDTQVDPGLRGALGDLPPTPYSEEILPSTPDLGALSTKVEDIEGQVPQPWMMDPNVGPMGYQTELSRRQALEQQSPFAVFLDELRSAGLGGLQGAAGRFIKSQYQPLYAGYQAEQLVPLIGNEIPFGEDLRGLSESEQQNYRQALMRQQTGDYEEGEVGAALKKLDETRITRFSPTFGEYARGGLQAGGRQAQQRMGQQLQALGQMKTEGLYPDSFASRFLAPESEAQAAQVMEMAGHAQAGRYSPVALSALQRYMPNASELWANYLRQSTPEVGDDPRDREGRGMVPPNFAQFVGQQYGLY